MRNLFVGMGLLLSALVYGQNYNVELVGSLDFLRDGNSVWAGVIDGKEYAFYGLTSSEAYVVIDISVPENPKEIFRGSGTPSLWRNLKVYDNFLYVVTEGKGDGISIVDLNPLTKGDNLSQISFTDGGLLRNTHTSFMDEKNGHLYLWGVNSARGVYVYDVKSTPGVPRRIAFYDTPYVHDGYVKNGIMYCSHINDGFMAMYDISNQRTAELLGNIYTPNNYCHNVWPTTTGEVAFTTDEKPDSYLTSYDVSEPSDMKELDRIQAAAGSNAIIHNVRLINDDFAAVAYYVEGLVLYSVSDPENIIEVGKYDMSPFAGNGFHGAWEVYPWLPSGNFVVSDIEEGLFVLRPELKEPARVNGTVIDGITKQPLIGVEVFVPEANMVKYSKIGGSFKTGYGKEGEYTVKFTKEGYNVKEVTYTNEGNGATLGEQVVEMYPLGSTVNETFQTLGLRMFPNPAQSTIQLEVPNSIEVSRYSVKNIAGQELLLGEIVSGQNAIDLDGLTAGLYMLEVTLINGQTISSKFVKK